MRRIFLDTNFIIDYLVRDNLAESAKALLTNGHKHGYQFYSIYPT